MQILCTLTVQETGITYLTLQSGSLKNHYICNKTQAIDRFTKELQYYCDVSGSFPHFDEKELLEITENIKSSSELIEIDIRKTYENYIKILRNKIPKDIPLDECLEKQIPQSPDVWGDGVGDDGELVYDSWDCPRCNTTYEIDYDKYNYCPNCGQRIDRERLE